MNLFECTSLQLILGFIWGVYRTRIIFYIILPFMVFFILFGVHSLYLYKVENPNAEEEEIGEDNRFASRIVIIIMSIIMVWLVIYELIQMINLKSKYFKTFWNYIDLFVVALGVAYLIMVYTLDPKAYQVAAIASLVFWAKLFYFFRIFETTAPIIRLVVQTVYDMLPFLLILVMAVLGFAHSFIIIAINENPEEPFTGDNVF